MLADCRKYVEHFLWRLMNKCFPPNSSSYVCLQFWIRYDKSFPLVGYQKLVESHHKNLKNILGNGLMELKENQAALILEIDEAGEVAVNVASSDHSSITARICNVIAEKLMGDNEFQEEIMSRLDDNE